MLAKYVAVCQDTAKELLQSCREVMSEAITNIPYASPHGGAPGDREFPDAEPGRAPGFFDSTDAPRQTTIEALRNSDYAAYIESKELTDADASIIANLAGRELSTEDFFLIAKSFHEAVQPLKRGAGASSADAQKVKAAREEFYQLLGMHEDTHPMAAQLRAKRKSNKGTHPTPYNLVRNARLFSGLGINPQETLSQDADLLMANVDARNAALRLRSLQLAGIDIRERPSLIKFDATTITNGLAKVAKHLEALHLPVSARDVILARPEILQDSDQKTKILMTLAKQHGDLRSWMRQATKSTLDIHKKLLADIAITTYIPLESHIVSVIENEELNFVSAKEFTRRYAAKARRSYLLEALQDPDIRQEVGYRVLQMYFNYAPLTDAETAAYPQLKPSFPSLGLPEIPRMSAAAKYEKNIAREQITPADAWVGVVAPRLEMDTLPALNEAFIKGSTDRLNHLGSEEQVQVIKNRKAFFELMGLFSSEHPMYEPFKAFMANTNDRLISPIKFVRIARMLYPHVGDELPRFLTVAHCDILLRSTEESVRQKIEKYFGEGADDPRMQLPYNFVRGITKRKPKPKLPRAPALQQSRPRRAQPSRTSTVRKKPAKKMQSTPPQTAKKVVPAPSRSRPAPAPKITKAETLRPPMVHAVLKADSIGQYLQEIKKIPLLDAKGEVMLAKRIEAGLFAARKLQDAQAKGEALDTQLRRDLQQIAREGDRAKRDMIEANLRLVVSLARRYQGRGLDLLELIQEGNLGLMHAVEKFDYTQGYKFATYAPWWIKQNITLALANQARTIRVPVHMVAKIDKLSRIRRELLQDLDRDPTPEELAKEMRLTPEKVQEIQGYARTTLSLDQKVDDENDAALQDFVADSDMDEHVTKSVLAADLQEGLRRLLSTLSEREVGVIRWRFGLVDGEPKTLHEISKKYGVTPERIHQIESKVIEKLRRSPHVESLRDYSE